MWKKFHFTLIALCLSVSSFAAPLMADTFSEDLTIAHASEKPAPPANGADPMLPSPGKECKPCRRPFKRLIAAMHELKKAGGMTEDEFKKAFNELVKIPKDTFINVTDMDQTAADTLYKAKIFTAEQYKKISEFLKTNPPKQ